MPGLTPPPRARPGAPDWVRDGLSWPHRDVSSFWRVGQIIWHLQRMGSGPGALLLHGTGASTHSWSGVLPELAQSHDVIAVDLPGHGFTQVGPNYRTQLPRFALDLASLLNDLDFFPELIVGHSAGAAVMIRLARVRPDGLTHLVAINGALKPFPGLAGLLAPVAAKALTLGGLAARAMANAARDPDRVERLLHQTGSHPPADSIASYHRLFQRPGHVAGTLAMMARWDLSGIRQDLEKIGLPILFLAGEQDQTVPASEADEAARQAQFGFARTFPSLGHLAHEEDPERVVRAIREFLSDS